MKYFLCHLDAMSDPGSRGFQITIDKEELSLFVVRQGKSVSAFRNHCPHTGVNLEWVTDQFLDIDNHYVQCASHGALFEPRSGLCVRGPCVGASLQALVVECVDGALYLIFP